MQTMELSHTDKRLDGLDRKVDGTNRRIDDLSREMHAEFRAARSEMNTRFDSLENRMLVATRTMQATVIGGFFTVFATLIATQL